MEYFWIVLPKMAGFLMLVCIGVIVTRLGIIKKEAMSSISGFLIKVVLPALTISLIWENQTTIFSMAGYGRIVIWQVVVYFFMAGMGILTGRIFSVPKHVRNVYHGCMVGGNYGFLVIPLIMALFAETGGNQYIPICSVVDTTVVWTLGFTLFTNGVGEKENPWKKIVLNPIFISILIGLFLTTCSIPVPSQIMDVISGVGNTSYSWGLIYLGCSIGFMEFRGILRYKSVLLLAMVKLLVVPMLVFLVSSRFLPQLESLLLMLISGAPSMTTSSMIARQYHLEEEYASSAVMVTTLLCMVTLPVLFLVTGIIEG